jgi:hypothetical protein
MYLQYAKKNWHVASDAPENPGLWLKIELAIIKHKWNRKKSWHLDSPDGASFHNSFLLKVRQYSESLNQQYWDSLQRFWHEWNSIYKATV